ncbi:MAG: hypothetical protein KBF93_27375 [Leptospiraceae bacterium]|nr:hypothetical protein [Leptospiraceae bacterium]
MTLRINRINLKELKNLRYKLKSNYITTEQDTSKEVLIEGKMLTQESEALYDLRECLKYLNKLQTNEFIEIEFDLEEK